MQGAVATGSRVVEGGRAIDVRTAAGLRGCRSRGGRLVVDASSALASRCCATAPSGEDYTVDDGAAAVRRRRRDGALARHQKRLPRRPRRGRRGRRLAPARRRLLPPARRRHARRLRPERRPRAAHPAQRRRADREPRRRRRRRRSTTTFSRGRVGVRAVATQRSLRDDLLVTAADGGTLLDERFGDEARSAASSWTRRSTDWPRCRPAADGPRANDPDAVVDLTNLARATAAAGTRPWADGGSTPFSCSG